MKKVLLSLLMISSISLVFGQHYPLIKELSTLKTKSTKGVFDNNLDFENWDATYAPYGYGEMPVGWIMMTENPEGQKSTDAQSGSFCMHIESNSKTENGELKAGTALIGSVANMDVITTDAYTERPLSISFYIKGKLLGNDTSIVSLELIGENKLLIGRTSKLLGADDISEEWQKFTLDIEYLNEENPIEISMIVTSGCVGVFSSLEIGTLTAGSYIDFDNISFGTNASINKEILNLSVYPNPANQFITINNAKCTKLSIVNMVGQVLISKNIYQNNQTINISEIPEGFFVVRIEKGNEVYVQKLNITR